MSKWRSETIIDFMEIAAKMPPHNHGGMGMFWLMAEVLSCDFKIGDRGSSHLWVQLGSCFE